MMKYMSENNLVNAAQSLAMEYHKGQKYGNRPYEFHLYEVYNDVLITTQYDADCVACCCVAWLHDILEDTPCTVACLSQYFGEEVVDAVISITKIPGEPYKEYISKVLSNKISHKVKISDTVCNLNASVESQETKRIDKYSKQLMLLLQYTESSFTKIPKAWYVKATGAFYLSDKDLPTNFPVTKLYE